MIEIERLAKRHKAYREKCEYWSNKITAYYLSGQRLKPFCEESELAITQFRKWLYKLNLSRPVRAAKTCGGSEFSEMELKFIPVTLLDINEKTNEADCLDIILSSGDKIRLSKGFDTELLIRTILTLRGVSC